MNINNLKRSEQIEILKNLSNKKRNFFEEKKYKQLIKLVAFEITEIKIDKNKYKKELSFNKEEQKFFSRIKKITFKEYQKILVDGFVNINNDFIKNNIFWWPESGTLIGALREKALIEWDDDIDMGIKYEEYFKNKEIINEIANKYGFELVDNIDENNGWDIPRIISKEGYVVEYEGDISLIKPFIDLFIQFPLKKKTFIRKLLNTHISPPLYFLYNDWYNPFPKVANYYGNLFILPNWVNIHIKIIRILFPKWILLKIMKSKYKTSNHVKENTAENFYKYSVYSHRGKYIQPSKGKWKNTFGTKLWIVDDIVDHLNEKYKMSWLEKPNENKRIPQHILMHKYFTDMYYKKQISLDNNQEVEVNLVININHKFIEQTKKSLNSLLEKTKAKVNLFIYTFDPNLEIEMLNSVKEEHSNLINMTLNKPDPNLIKNPNLSGNLSLDAYARLFAFEDLKHKDKMIYFDMDSIINRDILEIYNFELGDESIIGVKDSYAFLKIWKLFLKKYPYYSDMNWKNYINSGMILANPKKLSEDNFYSKAIDLLATTKFKLHDQDLLNYLIPNKTLIHYRYNFSLGYNFIDRFGLKKPVMIHYQGINKPWDKGFKRIKFIMFWGIKFYRIYNKKNK